jgi:ribosomal protein S18 acetylase RimI-like enzyme
MTLFVRKLKREDLPRVRRLARLCFDPDDKKRASLNFDQYFKFGHDRDTLSVNRLENWISIEYYVVEAVLQNEKTIIGMFGLYSMSWSSDCAVWLDWLGVDPLFQKKGVGLACVDFAQRIAKSKDFLVMCIESSPRYKKAEALYLKQGFKLKVRIDDYFEDRDPLFLYVKEL